MLRLLRQSYHNTGALKQVWNRPQFLSTASQVNVPKVALVGRTNVGKSTLFNRLTGSRKAIVHNVPGTTRDRREAPACLAGMDFTLIDTGGLLDSPIDSLEQGMQDQTEKAIKDSDLIFFMIDGRQGLTPVDKELARWLRKRGPKAPVRLIANKLEGYPTRFEDAIDEFYELGMGTAIPLSAEHAEGMSMLVDELVPVVDKFEADEAVRLQEESAKATEEAAIEEEGDEEKTEKESIKLAIVGRPNTGKSSLLNQLIRDERLLTGDMPGVTRDAVEIEWEFSGRRVRLVDTAGIRKIAKRDHSNLIETLSVRDAEQAIAAAQVVAVVVDLEEDRFINLDLAIAQKVLDEGRTLVVVANKSDLVPSAVITKERVREHLDSCFAQIPGVPLVLTSALTGAGVRQLMPTVLDAYSKWNSRVSTGKLNRWKQAIDRHHPPPTVKGKTLKVKFITQTSIRPPAFTMFVNKPDDVPEEYRRFLMKQLREEFEMQGVPIRLNVRGSSNRYHNKTTGKKKSLKAKKRVGK